MNSKFKIVISSRVKLLLNTPLQMWLSKHGLVLLIHVFFGRSSYACTGEDDFFWHLGESLSLSTQFVFSRP